VRGADLDHMGLQVGERVGIGGAPALRTQLPVGFLSNCTVAVK
jgi:hypothetical protein